MLNPHYVTGFVDGEGCFSVSISRKRFRVPEVRLRFEIELREDDEPILQEIQKLLECGSIYRLEYERYKKWRPHVKFMVGSYRDIKSKIIPFFKKYPLQAKKKKQFEFFCRVAGMIENEEHKTHEGIEKIRSLRGLLRHKIEIR
ncbi:MAG: LAGLIDADG homing endonuclease [Candidatus Daviesbacteria bacterium GW2011_GWA2_42_7]|uniref:LAGLIDADG homing endonuclease n=1 Tax=Candidatus Daviesbacteria bacterium GW2011_GWA2_42_7 TaxID=1618425 RepID=A0A0G1BA64_9BACT|nr:MAG: LAGLIDADG homing endonuclease [Candidatus Daviesbacteria bacterium GW2011_GWA2_42_7]